MLCTPATLCALKLEEEDGEVAVEEAVEQRASFAHLGVKGCQWGRRLIATDHAERRPWTRRPEQAERAGMAVAAHARRQHKKGKHTTSKPKPCPMKQCQFGANFLSMVSLTVFACMCVCRHVDSLIRTRKRSSGNTHARTFAPGPPQVAASSAG